MDLVRNGNESSTSSQALEQREQQLRKELETLHILDPENNSQPLECQYDGLTEAEQKRLIEKLILQNEADIQTFSTFLKLPTVVVLILNLVFAYNYAVGGFDSRNGHGGAVLPFTEYKTHASRPLMATELAVVTLQFTLYLLTSGRWNRLRKCISLILAISGAAHSLTCDRNGVAEFVWWILPALNLTIVCYAQLNMRRSREEIQVLAARSDHLKNA
ncbi:hypothetical protein COEREDRAFT_79573 [Coemansia reversa NRRL 1564]|uniref:Uncharacterized protein n=1 Tax=Coemansia reversa (strain ATCC 12441 / NRRL 1564) TaxID=763665 RepID=A0A2G5BJ73_COERN|nr:hypothetical protein COEREDRAFT_79573 [Coemansia reversa NRRL 1564]|eukprot:PIA19070.1 hypothetical protein COEREDRAFT_79573 [Coemansia reversa NRRL 1564]